MKIKDVMELVCFLEHTAEDMERALSHIEPGVDEGYDQLIRNMRARITKSNQMARRLRRAHKLNMATGNLYLTR